MYNSKTLNWKKIALYATPFIGYLLLVSFFINQIPMHEEIVHIRDTSSWEAVFTNWYHPPLYIIIGRLAKSLLGDTYQVLYLI